MAADHEQPDDGDEAQLAWLLTSAHDAPPLRAEFVDELSRRLDAEFATAGAEYVQRNGHAALAPHAMNGSAPKEIEAERVEVAKPIAKPIAKPRAVRSRVRWVVGAAVAASLMMAVAVWADPPAWQAVLQPLRGSPGGHPAGWRLRIRPAERRIRGPSDGERRRGP